MIKICRKLGIEPKNKRKWIKINKNKVIRETQLSNKKNKIRSVKKQQIRHYLKNIFLFNLPGNY